MSAPIRVLLAEAAAALAVAGIDEPAREARLLLAHALGSAAALLERDRVVDDAAYRAMVGRRACR